MTEAPIAYTVHDGHARLPSWRRQLIAAWLTANDINPGDVSTSHAITVLTVPFRPPEAADDGDPWLVQVISLRQYYVNCQGAKEQNLITRKAVTFQRTVPLKVPFPADHATADEGTADGQADSETAEEAAQVLIRDQEQEGVPHRHEGQSPQRPGEGKSVRDESTEKAGSGRGDQAVSEPQEVRRGPEEVGGK